mgnify:FL=1
MERYHGVVFPSTQLLSLFFLWIDEELGLNEKDIPGK